MRFSDDRSAVLNVGMIGQHLDHGRHQQGGRNLLLLDRGDHQFRAEGPDDHIGAAADQRSEHRAAIGEVEHRRGVEIDRAVRQQALAQHVQRVAGDVGVAQHHALGTAGGAAGVEDAGQILARGHRVRNGLARSDQFLVVLRLRRSLIVIGIDQFHRHGFRELDAHFGKRLVDDEHRSAAVVQGVFDLGVAPADVGGHDHRARPGDTEIEFEVAVGIEHQHRDPVASLDAELLQPARELCDALADLAPGAAAVAVDGGDACRVGLQHPAQALGHIHHNSPCYRGRSMRLLVGGDHTGVGGPRKRAAGAPAAACDSRHPAGKSGACESARKTVRAGRGDRACSPRPPIHRIYGV